jgi:hypothetical protein
VHVLLACQRSPLHRVRSINGGNEHVRELTDPSPLLTGTATWSDAQAAHGHARHCRAEDYLTAVVYRLLRTGPEQTRQLVVWALLAEAPHEVRHRVTAAGPLRAAYLRSRRKPDLALYDRHHRIVLVVEAKLAHGPSQACNLALLLRGFTPDKTPAPGVDLHSVATSDDELWQLDTYALLPAAWVPWDLYLTAAEVTWLFWTGHSTVTAATAYPGAFTLGHWDTTRHTATAAALLPYLRAGVLPAEDEPWVDLLVTMLLVPWRGRRRTSRRAALASDGVAQQDDTVAEQPVLHQL